MTVYLYRQEKNSNVVKKINDNSKDYSTLYENYWVMRRDMVLIYQLFYIYHLFHKSRFLNKTILVHGSQGLNKTQSTDVCELNSKCMMCSRKISKNSKEHFVNSLFSKAQSCLCWTCIWERNISDQITGNLL